MPRIRVMIVDDHEVVRIGLRTALDIEEDLEVVGEADSAEAGLREAEVLRPDVVLMDVRMPGMDGIQACRSLRDAFPDTRVVMLTSYGDNEAVFAAIMAGASGYLLKNANRTDLAQAVRAVASGKSLLDPGVTANVLSRLKDLTEKEQDRDVALLSDREKEVLSLVAQGLTNKEIAGKLIISENTARNHVSRIFDKLGMTRRSEAATFAAQHGLVTNDDDGRS